MTNNKHPSRHPRSLLTRIFLNQMALTISLVLLQIVIMIFAVYAGVIYIWHESQVWFWLLIIVVGIDLLLRIILTIVTLNRRIDPSYKIVWLVVISLLPVLGSLLFLFIQIIPNARTVSRMLTAKVSETRHYHEQDAAVKQNLQKQLPRYARLCKYLENYGAASTYQDNNLEFYPLGDVFFPDLLEELKKAEKFIFLEYFIITPGVMWDQILEILKTKVASGVEVRLMYDGFNTFTSLPRNYYKKMRKLGIKCRVFAPIKAVVSSYQNNRDHRKILVIDGRVGFVGGINLADEYINQYERFGHWKDTALKIEGSAVNALTINFINMWSIRSKKPQIVEPYLAEYREVKYPARNFVTPYTDAPENRENPGENIYLSLLANAERYYHIHTPYLVLNDRLLQALLFAAKRGIDVVIIMPAIPDKKIPFLVARSYYKELLDAGIKIYEYTPGFNHAKVVVSDDQFFTIGSVNFDFRSLYLNYENGVVCYDPAIAKVIEDDYQKTLQMSEKITLEKIKTFSVFSRLIGWVMRMFETFF
ncbi:MAG: cardiolipin synthase [Bacilli bacterium]|nr:cardiolipin synthase [Bacilli bacterium]